MKPSVVAVVLTLAITAVQAGAILSFEAKEVSFEKDAAVTGELVVLVQKADRSAPRSPDFVLVAKDLHVESDRTDAGLMTPVVGHSTDPQTEPADFENATVRGLSQRDGYLFHLFPSTATQVTLQGTCATLSQAPFDFVESDPKLNPRRESWHADASQGLAWSSCNGTSVSITGDFKLRLWEWDVHLDADEGSQILTSGRTPLVDGVPAERVYSASEQYLYATNASLHIPSLQGAYQVYLIDAAVEASEATFRQAVLELPRRVVREEVRVTGDLVLQLQRSGDTLSGTLAGVDGVDGALLALPASPATQVNYLPWLILILVAGLAFGARLMVRRYGYLDRVPSLEATKPREWRALRWLGLSVRANERGLHRVSRGLAKLAIRGFPDLPEAHKMLAIAQSHLGRHEEAVSLLEAVYEDLPRGRERAEAACCAAATCLRMKQSDPAAQWIKRALPEDPVFVLRRLDKPIYASLRDQPGFEALKAGSAAFLGHVAMDVAFA